MSTLTGEQTKAAEAALREIVSRQGGRASSPNPLLQVLWVKGFKLSPVKALPATTAFSLLGEVLDLPKPKADTYENWFTHWDCDLCPPHEHAGRCSPDEHQGPQPEESRYVPEPGATLQAVGDALAASDKRREYLEAKVAEFEDELRDGMIATDILNERLQDSFALNDRLKAKLRRSKAKRRKLKQQRDEARLAAQKFEVEIDLHEGAEGGEA